MFSTYLADPEINRLCGQESFIRQMLAFEMALATVQGQLGIIPLEEATIIAETLLGLTITPEALAEGTRQNGVPTIPLLALVRAALPESTRNYLHLGATSQDVMDTAQVLIIKDVIDVLAARIHQLLSQLSDLLARYGNAAMMGRTRTQQAQPIVFGQKITDWSSPLVRHLERLDQLKPRLLVVQLGGAVGNLAAYGDKGNTVALALATELKLGYSAPWHTQRDNFAEFASWQIFCLSARRAQQQH
jgi:3-carboxy-cis,cis-muconate cycloisomerase